MCGIDKGKQAGRMARGALELAAPMVLSAAIGVFIYWQAIHGGDPSEVASENSPIELLQLVLVVASAVLAGVAALRRREEREGCWLVAAFLACMAIRECDKVFDDLLFHGAWLPFALAVAAIASGAALARRRRALAGLSAIVRGGAYGLLCAGMSTVFVFSRVLGYKGIWIAIYRDVCGEEGSANLYRAIKNVAEEGTELFGYALIFVWAVETFLLGRAGDE